jgi:hypothetical protein
VAPHMFASTARKPKAQRNLLISIENPIDEELMFDGFGCAHRDDLERIQAEEFKRPMLEKRKREAEETTIMLY